MHPHLHSSLFLASRKTRSAVSASFLAVAMLLSTGGLVLTSLVSGCAATATRQSTGELVDDTTITAKVKADFVRDDTVKALDVSVTTFKGVVQLSGFVDTAVEKARAEQIAAAVSGVKSVQNNITVKTQP
jgi:hypothetical protein